MAGDQEWCLECGAARTVIARPPDWRIPVLVIAVVVALIAGGFAFALTQLDHNAGKVTVLTTGSTQRSSGKPASLASWVPGLDGYTVVLASAGTQKAAIADATSLQRAGKVKIKDIGVLNSSQHPEMTGPSQWDVFAGRYAHYALAQAAAKQAAHQGESTATPTLVQRPGGG